MWFLVTKTREPRFYLSDGTAMCVSIEWTHQKQTDNSLFQSNEPMVKNPAQAIAELTAKGVAAFATKPLAKEFAKTLPAGSWKYYRIR